MVSASDYAITTRYDKLKKSFLSFVYLTDIFNLTQ